MELTTAIGNGGLFPLGLNYEVVYYVFQKSSPEEYKKYEFFSWCPLPVRRVEAHRLLSFQHF